MKKTIIYIVLLAVLGAGVWYFLFSDKNVFGVDEAGFTIKDTGNIHRIFLADKSNNTITLERKDNRWMVNGSYHAMSSPVNTLLKTLATQEAMYPVPENMHNAIVKNMAAKGIKVELYDKKDKQIRVFYVGGQAGTNAGSYMLIEGAKRPYVVQVPVYEGYLTPRYSTSFADWRDRTVFDIPADQLRSVSVTYPTEPLNSFVLTRNDQGELNVQIHPALMEGNVMNQRRAKVYSEFFEKIYLEGYLNGTPGLDSIIANTTKYAEIAIVTRDGKTNQVDVYWKPLGKRSKNLDVHDPETPEGYDSDRFYATLNNYRDTAIIQKITFDKFFRRGFEFYEADQEADTSLKINTVTIPQI